MTRPWSAILMLIIALYFVAECVMIQRVTLKMERPQIEYGVIYGGGMEGQAAPNVLLKRQKAI